MASFLKKRAETCTEVALRSTGRVVLVRLWWFLLLLYFPSSPMFRDDDVRERHTI